MDPFIAEIRIFAGNFAPTGWAFCHGQLLPISQNTALFSLLGTVYGGNGTSTFALPDLRGRAPMHPNPGGTGLTPRSLGETVGEEEVTLLPEELPVHTHGPVQAAATPGTADSPAARFPAGGGAYGPTADTTMAPTSITGLGQPLSLMQPYLALNFIIALQGVYPPRP